MLGLFIQIKIFFLTLLLGLIGGFIIHFYQLTIRALKAGRHTLLVLDFIVWMFLVLVIALGILLVNQGELRLYTFILLVFGGVIYYKTMAPRSEPTLKAIVATAVHICKTMGKQIKRLIVWLFKGFHRKCPRRKPPLPPDEVNS